MTQEKWQAESTDAVLVAEFASNETALAIPGAEQFLLAEAGDAWEKPEKLLPLLQAAAKQEPTIAGHKILKRDNAIFHVFSQLSEGQKFAFAVRNAGRHSGGRRAGSAQGRPQERNNPTPSPFPVDGGGPAGLWQRRKNRPNPLSQDAITPTTQTHSSSTMTHSSLFFVLATSCEMWRSIAVVLPRP